MNPFLEPWKRGFMEPRGKRDALGATESFLEGPGTSTPEMSTGRMQFNFEYDGEAECRFSSFATICTRCVELEEFTQSGEERAFANMQKTSCERSGWKEALQSKSDDEVSIVNKSFPPRGLSDGFDRGWKYACHANLV